jgi:hypothetical protein
MKIIISERQLRQIIENESNERLLEVSIDDFLSAENVIIRQYKKRGYEGIKLYGDLSFYSNSWKDFERLFEHVIEIDGNLDLRRTNIKSLGNLESVSGYLDLGYCEDLVSLGNLKYVGDYLILKNTNMTTLNNLETVGSNLREYGSFLELSDTPIRDFGKLRYVGGDITLWNNKTLTSFGDLEEVGGFLSVNESNIKSIGKLRKVGGSLDLNFTEIKTLGNLEEVGGNLFIARCQELDSFGKLKYVGGGISMRKTPLAQRMSIDDIRNKIDVKGEIIIK